ncbi:MAG: hypothetical protein IPO65_00480 [Saprospiraceae bacterium]|nr:hypothetical protein [Saprospiraceae bacterium]
MKKEFAYNIFFLLIINLLIKPFYIFGIETKVQNITGPEAYGLYFSLFGLVFLHQFINDPGVQNFNTIFVAQNREQFAHHFPRLMGLKLILLGMLVSVSLFSAWIIGHDGIALVYLIGIALTLWLSTLFVLFRSMLSGMGSYRTDTWLSAMDRLLLIVVLGGMLLLGYQFTIEIFIWVQVICYTLCVIWAGYYLIRHGARLKPVFDWTYSQKFVLSCLPYAIIILLTGVVMRADGVLIERLLPDGKYQAGVYSAGYRFLDAANMFGYIFGALLLPMFSRLMAEKEDTQEVFSVAYRILFVMSLMIGGAFYFYADDVFAIFYGDAYAAGIPTMRLLILAVIPAAITNVFGPLILASRNIRQYNLLYLSAVIVYVGANFILIPKYGNIAAAGVAVFTWTYILAGMIYICSSNGLIKSDTSILIKSIAAGLSIYAIFWVFDILFTFNWLIELALIGIVVVLLLYVSKYIDLKEILHAARGKE